MGQRASNTATITFNDTEIPLDHLIGEENKGFKLAMMTLDRTRPGVAAMATGIARAAFEFATAVLQGARPVRRADRDAPGDPVPDRRHGDQGPPVAPRRLELRRAARPGQAQHARVLARQALRRRLRDGGHHRRRAGLRRLRLHQGLPRREADARREDHAALRGHVADPAPRDRARDAAPAPHRGARGAPKPGGGSESRSRRRSAGTSPAPRSRTPSRTRVAARPSSTVSSAARPSARPAAAGGHPLCARRRAAWTASA